MGSPSASMRADAGLLLAGMRGTAYVAAHLVARTSATYVAAHLVARSSAGLRPRASSGAGRAGAAYADACLLSRARPPRRRARFILVRAGRAGLLPADAGTTG